MTATKPAAKPRKITKAERAKAELANNKIRRDFDPPEIRRIAQAMASHSLNIQELESEKSAIASQYKSKIDTAKSEMQEAANKITAGFEIVTRECLVVYRPGKSEKDLFNPANGEFLAVEPMDEPDYQRELRLSKEAAKGKAAKGKERASEPGEPDTSAEKNAIKKEKGAPKSQGQIADALKKAADKKADDAAKKAGNAKK